VNECTWTSTSNTEQATTDTWTPNVDAVVAEDGAGDEDVAVDVVRTVEAMHQHATTHPLKAEDSVADLDRARRHPTTLELHWKTMLNSQHWVEKVWCVVNSRPSVGWYLGSFVATGLLEVKTVTFWKNKDGEEIVYMALLLP